MQESVKEVVDELEMPKSYRERLDELKVGQFIPLDDDQERDKFRTTMNRDFHKKELNTKLFSVRTNKKTKQRAIWRLA